MENAYSRYMNSNLLLVVVGKFRKANKNENNCHSLYVICKDMNVEHACVWFSGFLLYDDIVCFCRATAAYFHNT